jgi:flavin-dependent dehydrogenase
MSSEHEVIVVGGGPAGSTAANLLARAGRKVVLLERERFPRFHIGESLLPVNVPLLEQLGVRDELESIGSPHKHGVQLVNGDGTVLSKVYFRDGLVPVASSTFQVLRSSFDHVLLKASARAGADVREGARVVETRKNADSWTVRVAPEEGARYELHAPYLVDASGRDTILARKWRTKRMADGHRRLTLFAHLRGVELDPGIDAGSTILVMQRDGWFWLIPLPGGVTSVGVVMQGTTFRAGGRDVESAFEHALRTCPAVHARTERAERVTPVHTTSDFSYRTEPPREENCILTGDAFAFMDPIFSSGVWLAMQGGAKAAAVLDRCLAMPRRARTLLRRHHAGERRLHRHYWRLIEYFYRPEFPEVFLQPQHGLQLPEAVNSVLAGVPARGYGLRIRLAVFLAIVRLQRYLPLRPPVPRSGILEG